MAIKDRCRDKESLDSLEIPRRMGAWDGFRVANLNAGSLTRVCESNRREADESAESVHQRRSFQAMSDALARLARNPQDPCALVAVYDLFENHLEASAARWFRRDAELRRRVVLTVLVAIGRKAGTYDFRLMNAAEWVRRFADAEARRLREVLDAGNNRGRRTRRAM